MPGTVSKKGASHPVFDRANYLDEMTHRSGEGKPSGKARTPPKSLFSKAFDRIFGGKKDRKLGKPED